LNSHLQTHDSRGGPLAFDVITSEEDFLRLAPEWQALWQRCGGAFSESFELCRQAWMHVAKPGGRALAIVVGRRGGELVLVWPLVYLTRFSLRVLRPLGPAMADPTPLLFDRTCVDGGAFEAAWRALVGAVRPDLAYLTYLEDGCELQAFASSTLRARAVDRDVLFVVDVRGKHADWSVFCQARSIVGSRRKPGQLRRRLERRGKVQVQTVDARLEPQRIDALVEFILTHKRDWGERRGKRGEWLYSSDFRAMLSALIKSPEGRTCILVLELDGQVIAAAVLGCGSTSVAALISAFDPHAGSFSPGHILAEAYVRFAFERGTDLDFGVGSEELKRFWSLDEPKALTSYAVPVTLLGRLALAARDAASLARVQRRRLRGAAAAR
jgi:CelD/BcsL family acetyltransferase involved in cellulose biosynthesis